jgi:hypothetical protein
MSPSNNPEPWALGASARAVIAASPERLWHWIADPTLHPALAGSGEPQSIQMVDGRAPGIGACFESQQKLFGVIRYVARSEITKFEPNRHFQFRVRGLTIWEFKLEPTEGGTLVTHRTRIEPPAGLKLFGPMLALRERKNVGDMARTLQKLAQLVGAPPPVSIQVSYGPPPLD